MITLKNIDMKSIDYCIIVPKEMSLYVIEGETQYKELYNFIIHTLKLKVYNTGVPRDICCADLYREDGNLIFKFKAVPATAPTMSSYHYTYALILKENNIVL